MTSAQPPSFTAYQISLISLVAVILFTIVVDYMALSALSAILLPALDITTQEFGWVVSAYAFSAGISGLVAMGVADRFDRKRLLLFYYGGFLLGMLLCASATSLIGLIVARVVTGAFGGVVASICFAIVADLFADDQRGRVMGYVQLAFAAGLVLGLPLALYLATTFYWQLLYLVFFLLGLVLLGLVAFKLQPVDHHLMTPPNESALRHAGRIARQPVYWQIFANNFFLVLGDVLVMTLGSAYLTNNLGVSVDDLPLIFGLGGVATIVLSPVVGKLTDRYGKWRVFAVGTVSTMLLVGVFSNLNVTPVWIVALIHTLLFVGINARMIAVTAMTTVVPSEQDRGAFMALDASLQQLAGGVAAVILGWVVYQTADGTVQRYPLLGIIVMVVMLGTIGLLYRVHSRIEREQ